KATHDERDDWSEHAPSTDDQNEFIEKHGFAEYSKWHLGVDDDMPDDTKGHYSFPFGDFSKVHRCAVISLETRAAQYDHDKIAKKTKDLLDRIDQKGQRMPRSRNPFVAFRRRQVMPRWVRRTDAAAGHRINSRVTHPLVDRFYSRLSRSANRGALWFTIAAALLVFGRPRAAIRGSASLLGASMLANLVGKQVFGGDRPLLKNIPIGRQLKKSPTSGSFPSGHSASAAAFAAGVAFESPRIGAVVAPVAAGVAYSRLHTGAHWLSDVVGG